MSIADPPVWNDLELPPYPVKRFTVDEYHRMIKAGVFADDDRFELLEGWIIPKMTRNPPHEVAIDVAQEAIRAILPPGWRLRLQSAVSTADSEPEPDMAIIRGAARDFLGGHPKPADMVLVIEVSDSSLAKDRGIKQRLYARAGIPAYWIINLVDRRLEVHTDPTGPAREPAYHQREEIGPDGTVPLVPDGREVGRLAVRDLLP